MIYKKSATVWDRMFLSMLTANPLLFGYFM